MNIGTFVVLFGKFITTVAEQSNSESEDSGLVLEVEEPQKEDKEDGRISKAQKFFDNALPRKDDKQDEKMSLVEYYINKAQVPTQKEDKTEPKISNPEYYNHKAVLSALKDDTNEPKMLSDEYNINKVQVVPQKDDLSAAKMSNVEYYIKEAKTVIDKANELIENTNFRRDLIYDPHTKFTDFILHLIKILKQYDDKDLEDFVGIVNDEIRKYHYRGCKFHEVINNNDFRRYVSKKLDVIKTMTVADIRHGLEAISAKLKQRNYSEMERELVDFINSLYKEESVHNFNTVLVNIDNYRMQTRKTMNLIQVLRDALRSVIFDHFTDPNTNVRIALKTKLDEFWDYLVGIFTSFVMQHYLTRLKLSDRDKIITNDLSDEKVVSVETSEDSSSNECNVARNGDENREHNRLKHKFINNNTKLLNAKEKKSLHIQESSKHFKVLTTLGQMYVESVDNNFMDTKMRLNNKKDSRHLSNIKKKEKKKKDSGKKQHFIKIEDGPTTLRQMYLKEIDWKYNTQAHIESVEVRSKDAGYKNKIKKNSMPYSAKTIERPTTLRKLHIESMNVKYPQTKYQQNTDKYSANFRSNDKHQHSQKKKYIKKTTDDPTTLRQMFLERIDSKYDSQFMKFRSKHKNFKKDIGRTNDATTFRQMYLESIELNDSSARNNKIKKRKSKINKLININPSYIVLYSENMQRLLKSTDEPSTPRRVQVEVMDLQYGPRDNSTELINKRKITTNSGKGNVRLKNKLRHRKKHNHTKNSKEHKKHNMFIDLDSKFLNQRHFQLKTTKNIRSLRYLDNADNQLAAIEKDKGKILESGGAATRQMYHGVKEKLIHTNKQKENQIEGKKGMDLRVDKKLTLGNPTTMNTIEEHNAIIKFNKVKIPKPRKTSELKHKTSNKEMTTFSRVYNTIPRRQTLMDLNIKSAISGKSKRIRKPLKTTANTKDRKLNITADPNMSEEGLSIEELIHSHRRMDSNDPGESILNDTEVLTKIRQLENELKVVKTKLENDTEIIGNLNIKICETENRLKEFCNQEFKIVKANRNIPDDDRSVDSRADINDNDEKAQEDGDNEYNPKRFQIARSRLNQDEVKQSKKQFIPSSNSNKDNKVIAKKSYKDTNNLNDTSHSDDENTADIPDETMKTEADTKATDIKTNSVSIIDKLKTKDDKTTESDLNKNNNKKEVTTQIKLQEKDKVNLNKGKRVGINDTHTNETSKNELNRIIESNKGTFRQNSEVINSKQSESDTDNNNNVHMINKSDYSGENDNYYKTESKNAVKPKSSRKGNNKMIYKYDAGQYMKDMKESQLAQNKIPGKGQFQMEDDNFRRENSQDVANQRTNVYKTQAAPFIKTIQNFNRKPEAKFDAKSFFKGPNSRKQLKNYEDYEKKESYMSEVQRMINNPFDRDGVMMDMDQMHEMEGQMFGDMPDAEADPIAQWLNVTSTKTVNTTYTINENDNPFKDIDGVLGRLAKEKVRYGR